MNRLYRILNREGLDSRWQAESGTKPAQANCWLEWDTWPDIRFLGPFLNFQYAIDAVFAALLKLRHAR